MNERYEAKRSLGAPFNPVATDAVRQPMLSLLLNDISKATQETADLAERFEQRLKDISQLKDVANEVLKCPLETPLAPALELLRSTLNRVRSTNRNLEAVLEKLEI